MPPKSIFSALGAPMSLAWVHESPSVEGSALPKSVESGKLSLNKVGIGRMSVRESSRTNSMADVFDEPGWARGRRTFARLSAALTNAARAAGPLLLKEPKEAPGEKPGNPSR